MAKETLSVYENGSDEWCICWMIDGEQGGDIGDRYIGKGEPGANDYESYVVQEAVRASDGCRIGRVQYDGFYFESRKEAVAAKRAADFARKNMETPMPQWAIQAAAAGWKAPKGWKP
jgi:hypothetical protein